MVESPTADLNRVRHMLDAVREALGFAKGKSVKELHENRMLALALIKELELIGEAASKVSPVFQQEHPEIPWATVIAMRHRLIHGYHSINIDVIWKTISDDLPDFGRRLEKVLEG